MAKRKSSGGSLLVLKSRPRKTRKKRTANVARISASIYSVHPAIVMLQKWSGELKAKTGRTLEEWITHIQADGPSTEKDCRQWLKDTYELGGSAAAWLAGKALTGDRQSTDATPQGYLAQAPLFVEQMYAGPRAVLRPMHNALIDLARELGGDVRICPCKTMIPLYRRHMFAQVRPATSKRIDLGFALGEEPFTSRLHDTGGRAKKDRITHSVAIASLADIDLQVKRWLREAYERDA